MRANYPMFARASHSRFMLNLSKSLLFLFVYTSNLLGSHYVYSFIIFLFFQILKTLFYWYKLFQNKNKQFFSYLNVFELRSFTSPTTLSPEIFLNSFAYRPTERISGCEAVGNRTNMGERSSNMFNFALLTRHYITFYDEDINMFERISGIPEFEGGELQSDSSSEDEDETILIEEDSSDTDSIDSDNSEYDYIYYQELAFLEQDRQTDKYYIGLCYYGSPIMAHHPIYNIGISPTTFFRYDYDTMISYLILFSGLRTTQKTIQIMKLYIQDDGLYTVTIKTIWLKLIQIHWKKIYKERCAIIRKRGIPNNRHYTVLYGRYPGGLNYLPSLKGMMSIYGKK